MRATHASTVYICKCFELWRNNTPTNRYVRYTEGAASTMRRTTPRQRGPYPTALGGGEIRRGRQRQNNNDTIT
eukprot:5410284-Pyramimonas_sp.AAC.1